MIYKRNKHFVAPRNRHRGLARFFFWFTLVAFLGAVGYTLFFSPFLAITTFQISGEKYVSESDIAEQVNALTSGKIWNAVNRNNLLLVKKATIQKNILQKFRQIRSVEVRKKFPHELDVRVLERVPTIIFQGANGNFILDENAVAYDTVDPQAPVFQSADLPRLIDADGKNVSLGDTVLSGDYVAYLLGVKAKMKSDTEISISNDFQTPSLISKDIRVKVQEGWGIYFNENISLDKEIEMLNVVLNHEIDKSQRPDLDYIDLRIDNKVYYKFKDGTSEEAARLAQAAADATAQPAVPVVKDEKKKK